MIMARCADAVVLVRCKVYAEASAGPSWEWTGSGLPWASKNDTHSQQEDVHTQGHARSEKSCEWQNRRYYY